jgi:Hemerythrin HHE cation binding domain
MVVAHRAMRRDLARVAALAGDIAGRDQSPRRAGAICRYTAALLAEVRAHQQGEDEVLWPVIAATAGQAVDLAPLADDHQAIEAATVRVGQALASLAAEPYSRAEALPAPVSALRDMVDEHIADEEAQLFPAMRRRAFGSPCPGWRGTRPMVSCARCWRPAAGGPVSRLLPAVLDTAGWNTRHSVPAMASVRCHQAPRAPVIRRNHESSHCPDKQTRQHDQPRLAGTAAGQACGGDRPSAQVLQESGRGGRRVVLGGRG